LAINNHNHLVYKVGFLFLVICLKCYFAKGKNNNLFHDWLSEFNQHPKMLSADKEAQLKDWVKGHENLKPTRNEAMEWVEHAMGDNIEYEYAGKVIDEAVAEIVAASHQVSRASSVYPPSSDYM
jgi:hypothetical protein